MYADAKTETMRIAHTLKQQHILCRTHHLSPHSSVHLRHRSAPKSHGPHSPPPHAQCPVAAQLDGLRWCIRDGIWDLHAPLSLASVAHTELMRATRPSTDAPVQLPGLLIRAGTARTPLRIGSVLIG